MLHRLLAGSRYLLVVPVIGCVLVSLGIVAMGVGRIVAEFVNALGSGDFSPQTAKALALAAIEIIDLFLIATVSYITAMGLYKLFISDAEIKLPMRLQITSLKDLEDTIIGVLVAAMAVLFLGHAASGDEATALLHYGGGIALVIAALAWFVSCGAKQANSLEKRPITSSKPCRIIRFARSRRRESNPDDVG